MIKSQEAKATSDKIKEKLVTSRKSKPVITVTKGLGQIDCRRTNHTKFLLNPLPSIFDP